jgi:hypothetical protein
MTDEITLQRSDLRAMTAATWVAASFAWLGVALLLQRATNLPPALNTTCGFVVAAAVWFPLARLLYRLRGSQVSLARYAIIWLSVALAVTVVRYFVG